MSTDSTVRALDSALGSSEFERRTAGRRPAVFLDYDGVLTPIVERPEDAVLSTSMREVLRALADRCPVCIVTGRDRAVVQDLMGVTDLTVAGSHGFDIWRPGHGAVVLDGLGDFTELIARTTATLTDRLSELPGVHLEPKRASVAVHVRQAAPPAREQARAVVDVVLAESSGDLELVPGKMVYELRPAVDWNKGKAVVHLLEVLGLDSPDVVPLYLGDDITDEDAFRALRGRGVGILVGSADDPEMAGRTTAAEFVLGSVDEVERFLRTVGM